jgi:hypothetical protein
MQINGKNVNVKRYSSFEERNVNNVAEPIRATRDDFNCADHLVRKFEHLVAPMPKAAVISSVSVLCISHKTQSGVFLRRQPPRLRLNRWLNILLVHVGIR